MVLERNKISVSPETATQSGVDNAGVKAGEHLLIQFPLADKAIPLTPRQQLLEQQYSMPIDTILYKMRFDDGMSKREMGRTLNVSEDRISIWLDQRGIEPRDRKASNRYTWQHDETLLTQHSQREIDRRRRDERLREAFGQEFEYLRADIEAGLTDAQISAKRGDIGEWVVKRTRRQLGLKYQRGRKPKNPIAKQ